MTTTTCTRIHSSWAISFSALVSLAMAPMGRRVLLSVFLFALFAGVPAAEAFDDSQEANIAYEMEDYETAFSLFLKIAGQGRANAQFNVAVMLQHGRGGVGASLSAGMPRSSAQDLGNRSCCNAHLCHFRTSGSHEVPRQHGGQRSAMGRRIHRHGEEDRGQGACD